MSPDESADAEWFDGVFRDHASQVHRYFLRRAPGDDAEDLAAEVLAIAWRRRASVPHDHVLPWLYRTAGYVLANYRRKSRPVPVEIEDDLDEHPGQDPADAAADASAVRAALAHLSDREREVLMLNAWEGLSGTELADVLGISRGGAAAALSRARARLRRIWDEELV